MIREEHKTLIEKFIDRPVLETARNLYNFILKTHQKEDLFTYVEDLLLYEITLVAILPDHRDHFLHSASVEKWGQKMGSSLLLTHDGRNVI